MREDVFMVYRYKINALRIFFTLLTTIITFCFGFPKTAYAEEEQQTLPISRSDDGFIYSVKDDNTVILYEITLDDQNSGTVNIPETIDGKSVTEIGEGILAYLEEIFIPRTVTSIPVFRRDYYESELKNIIVADDNPVFSSDNGVLFDKNKEKIIIYPANKEDNSYSIPDGVKEICDYAFARCENLRSITLADSVEILGVGAFSHSQIEEMKITRNVKEIGDGALADIPSERYEIDSENNFFKISNEALYSSDGHILISIPNNVLSQEYSVDEGTEIISAEAFNTQEQLLRVTLPDSLNQIGNYAFDDCNNLENINIPDNVKKIGKGAFSGCSLKEVTSIGDGIEIIEESAFSYTDLHDITFPESLKEIHDYAFSMVDFDEIILPSHLEYLGYAAFSTENEITKVVIPQSLLTIEEGAFSSVITKQFVVDDSNPNYAVISGVLFDKNKTALVRYPIASEVTEYNVPSGIIEISEGAFQDSLYLNYIYLPESVRIIGENAFSDSELLEEVNISGEVEIIPDSAFGWCTALRTIDFNKGLKQIDDSAFYACDSLSSVTFPTTLEIIGSEAFCGCDNLQEVYFNDGLKTICDGAFQNCVSIEYIHIPDSVETIGTNAFWNCDSLEEVYIGRGLKQLGDMTITGSDGHTDSGDLVFSGSAYYWFEVDVDNAHFYSEDGVLFNADTQTLVCYPTLKPYYSYEIPEGTRTIGVSAFENQENLENIWFPATLTNIQDDAFNGCYLDEFALPDNLERIGAYAFGNVYGTSYVYIPSSVKEIGRKAFIGGGYKEFEVSDDNPYYYTVEGVLFSADEKKLIAYPCQKDNYEYEIPDGIQIIDSVFFNSDNLHRLVIPSSVEEILGDYGLYFDECDNLDTIIVEKGSYAETWAQEHGYNIEYRETYDWLNE